MKTSLIRCIGLALLLTVCVIPLTGCHGSRTRQDFVMPETFDTSRQYEINFWAKNDTNLTQVNIYHQAIADFQSLYPNITVNLRLYTDYGKIYNDIITNLATGTTPNVCITYPDHIATYLTGENTVVPLDSFFDDPRYGLGGDQLRYDGPTRDQLIPRFLEECAIEGVHYAIPYMRSTEACYVNKTYVEALGYQLPEVLTWDFVWEVSRAAMAKDESGKFLVNGQETLIPFIYKSTDNMMITQLRQKEAGYSNPTGEILLFNDETQSLLEAIAPAAGSRVFSTFKISGYPGNFLNAGQCIFAVDSTAGATWMGTDAPNCDIDEDALVEFETAVLPVPQFDPDNPRMISQGPSMCIFNKEDPQEVLASWLFAQYMLTDEVQVAYSQTEGYLPVTLKALESDAYQNYLARSGEDNELYYSVKLDASRMLMDRIEQTFVTPVFNGSASLRDAAGQLIESVTKSMRRGETVDDAYYDVLYADMIALYRLDQIGANLNSFETTTPLPAPARILIFSLLGAWILMGGYAVTGALRRSRSHE